MTDTSPRSQAWPRRTAELLLRPLVDADIADVLRWRNHPDVTRWLLRTTMDAAAMREGLRARSSRGTPVAVVHEGLIVGTAFIDIRDGMGQDLGPEPVGAEGLIGFVFDPAVHGRGFATQVAEALLDVAFGDLDLRRVTAGCFADNTASWRVMEKVGMRREQHGVEDSWHAELGWVDGYTYAMLRSEWLAKRG